MNIVKENNPMTQPLFSKRKQLKHRVFEDQGSYMAVPKKKKVKKTTLRNKADALFSKFIRQKGYCEFAFFTKVHCGGSLQCMHGKTRGRNAIRFDPMNAWCGCAGHHVWFTNNNDTFEKVLQEHFPEKWKYIEEHQNDTVKKTEDLYREVIEKYKDAL